MIDLLAQAVKIQTGLYRAIIETKKGSKIKNEIEGKEIVKKFKGKVPYVTYYGTFPMTLALDHDPLDCYIFSDKKLKVGDVVDVVPVSVIKTVEDKLQDDKVICVVKGMKEVVNSNKVLNFILKCDKKGRVNRVVDKTIYDRSHAISAVETAIAKYRSSK